MSVTNKVQLITYPDSLGGDLPTLHGVLKEHFPGVFGGLHILPPFPSSGDRGFAPLTYLEIDAAFGSWEDIREIGTGHELIMDLMVNHISAKSAYFQDFLHRGRGSEHADLFLTIDKIFPEGSPTPDQIEMIFLRRDEPYSDFTIESTGEVERVWTTFGKVTPSEQIDLDVSSPQTRELLVGFLENFSRNAVTVVRLDAIGYVIKKPGTTCFMVEPEISEFLGWITRVASGLGLELLPEVHAPFPVQSALAQSGHWIYDFVLPYMILEALTLGSNERLVAYLAQRPHNQFTMLDCHDGIPIKPDLDGLVETAEAKAMVDVCLERGANLSLIFSTKHESTDGFNVHQIRGSYFSLLGEDEDAYIAARAIQFFTPGIPQVYYVGLLAGRNDVENVERTGEGREINRHNYSATEIAEAVASPVVKRLIALIRFRNEHPAFGGEFSIIGSDQDRLILGWEAHDSWCRLGVNLGTGESIIDYSDDRGQAQVMTL